MSEWQVINGDSLDVLKQLPDACIDSLVTDPPAGIGFMGREWDSAKGGRVSWIAWLEELMREVSRVLKPGAHGLVWALPRTSHWTATALEQAGFEIRDVVIHAFGTGFPKSLNVSKAIDEAAGAVREVIGVDASRAARLVNQTGDYETASGWSAGNRSANIEAPATDAAKQWDGWGTALKPATEHWILVRKPLSGTVASNVQEHGTGALNIDACRIAGRPEAPGTTPATEIGRVAYREGQTRTPYDVPEGRWPANLVLSHTEWCEPVGVAKVKAAGSIGKDTAASAAVPSNEVLGEDTRPRGEWNAYGNGDGTETVTAWRCLPGCPVALLDAQSGPSVSTKGKPRTGPNGDGYRMTATGAEYTDKGGASRFFYVSKPSTKEREDGLAHLPKKSGGEIVDRAEDSAGINDPRAGAGRTAKGRANFHPTVKSIGLMSWLVKLISPPGGVVLDPFCGSGSTGVAAVKGGWSFLGIDKDPEYIPIAEGRIGHANGEAAALVETVALMETVALSSPALVPDLVLSPGAILCMVCHEPQFETTGGFTCENGHGGALSTSVASLTSATSAVVDSASA